MADAVDLKSVVKHLVDGTFDENLCRICLLPLAMVCENIFTRICKEDEEYCIADVLEKVCNLKFPDTDNCNICSDCFLMATTAYKFLITAKRSDEILNFYVEELEKNIYSIAIPEDCSSDTLCITLPEFEPELKYFDYDIESCLIEECFMQHDTIEPVRIKTEFKVKQETKYEPKMVKATSKNLSLKKEDDELIMLVDKKGQQTFYKVAGDGNLVSVSKKNASKSLKKEPEAYKKKISRKRDPMTYTQCSRCPVKYRFLAKLKGHMKAEHDVDLFICKICKAITEDEIEYENHLAGHTGIHRCDYCNTIFKKRETIIAHLKWHEEMKNIHNMDTIYVCELCGFIVLNEEQLTDHYDKKHDKKYTCFYCGKMYKGEMSCEAHIRKHEMHMIKDNKHKKLDPPPKEAQPKSSNKKRTICPTCGKDFVDERSLMWHSMLHTNERPYTCDVCGRGFISVNRRNQHVICAHTMPTKQCPLCPALFHLRSMVNSHIKKVHLRAHKRRNRNSKHRNMNIHWRTETVPIQELGVDIQNQTIELKSKQTHPQDDDMVDDQFDL